METLNPLAVLDPLRIILRGRRGLDGIDGRAEGVRSGTCLNVEVLRLDDTLTDISYLSFGSTSLASRCISATLTPHIFASIHDVARTRHMGQQLDARRARRSTDTHTTDNQHSTCYFVS